MATVDIVCAPGDVPGYTTAGSVGADLRAAGDYVLGPGHTAIIPTGVRLAVPAGLEAQVRSRSGLAAKHRVAVLNSPGTIDQDYRGEIKVILVNHGRNPFAVTKGMRVAQLVFAPVVIAKFVSVEQFAESTVRGEGGLGSTGTH